ncbi:hypothetical protein M0812_05964 [Anaeramoeba flamelloides]|uniref:Uncharacterized protein n=1 Tax=Anaeramoeba flamelloides TaxID=1746091 RepID=A0AAV8AAE8_9EUKA|nr:hypothetical protein M0812_05964 [Anaeramoeba flamelloides]
MNSTNNLKANKKSNYKLQKKKERNRASCKSYYPDKVEETEFGSATEEEQLSLIDVASMRKREDRIAKLYTIFPEEITFSWNKGRVEFSARIINLLCYAYGQGRTNVRSCLGSYFKRQGYQNLTVRRKNTGMVFVTNDYVKREQKKQEIRKRKFEKEEKKKEEQEEKQKRLLQRKRQKVQKKQPNISKKRRLISKKKKLKIQFKLKPKRSKTKKTTTHSKTKRKAIKTKTRKGKTKVNSKLTNFNQKKQKIFMNGTEQQKVNTIDFVDQKSKNDFPNFEKDFFSIHQSNPFIDCLWEESTQNSNDLQSDSPINSPFLSEIQPGNESQQQCESVLSYQFETEYFSNFISMAENEFELSTLKFD